MAKKKRVTTTDDLPTIEPPLDKVEPIWDPAGNYTPPEAPPEDHNAQQTDPDLQEFLKAIGDAKDADSELTTMEPMQ